MVTIAFVGVLLGWWSDRQRMEERIRQRDDLLSVLRAVPTFEEDQIQYISTSGFVWASTSVFEGVDDFLASFEHDSEWTRQDGPQWSFHFKSDDLAKAAIPRLIPFLKDADASVRRRAAFALCRIGKLPRSVVPRLLVAASDECPGVRSQAVDALSEVEGTVEGLGPRLLRFLNDDDPQHLINLIATIRTKDPTFDLNPHLASLLVHPNPKTRAIAAAKLSIGPDTTRDILSRLLAMLGDNDCECRKVAARALQDASPTQDRIEHLIRAFQTEADERVRGTIARTVAALDRKMRE